MIKMVIADSRNVLKTMVVSGVVMVGAFLSGHVSHASGLLGDGSLQANLGLTSIDQWSSSTTSPVANTDGSIRGNLALQVKLQSDLRLDGDNTGTVAVSSAGNDQTPIWVGGQARTKVDVDADAKGKANLGAGLTVRANNSANVGTTVSTTTNTPANARTTVSTTANTSANAGTTVSLSGTEANGNTASAADVALQTNLSSGSTPITATMDHAAPAKQIALSAKANATLDSDTPTTGASDEAGKLAVRTDVQTVINSDDKSMTATERASLDTPIGFAGKHNGVHADAVVNVKLGSHSGNMGRPILWLWLKANLIGDNHSR